MEQAILRIEPAAADLKPALSTPSPSFTASLTHALSLAPAAPPHDELLIESLCILHKLTCELYTFQARSPVPLRHTAARMPDTVHLRLCGLTYSTVMQGPVWLRRTARNPAGMATLSSPTFALSPRDVTLAPCSVASLHTLTQSLPRAHSPPDSSPLPLLPPSDAFSAKPITEDDDAYISASTAGEASSAAASPRIQAHRSPRADLCASTDNGNVVQAGVCGAVSAPGAVALGRGRALSSSQASAAALPCSDGGDQSVTSGGAYSAGQRVSWAAWPNASSCASNMIKRSGPPLGVKSSSRVRVLDWAFFFCVFCSLF